MKNNLSLLPLLILSSALCTACKSSTPVSVQGDYVNGSNTISGGIVIGTNGTTVYGGVTEGTTNGAVGGGGSVTVGAPQPK